MFTTARPCAVRHDLQLEYRVAHSSRFPAGATVKTLNEKVSAISLPSRTVNVFGPVLSTVRVTRLLIRIVGKRRLPLRNLVVSELSFHAVATTASPLRMVEAAAEIHYIGSVPWRRSRTLPTVSVS